METRADNLRGIALSIGFHGLLFVLLVVGLVFQRDPEPLSVAGGAIEAVLMQDLSMPTPPPPKPRTMPQPKPAAPAPQPRPEPKPQDAPTPPQPAPQAPQPKPDSVDQEKIVREAALQAENARREQEERRRQEQIQLDEKKQQEEAERRRRLAQQQAERDKQLADIRRELQEAEKKRKLEEERLKQLRDLREQAASQTSTPQPTPAPPAEQLGNQGVDDALLGRYSLAIQQQVDRNWLRPDNLRPGLRCVVQVTQLRGGQVSGVDFARCQTDALTQRSIEAALMREPLPYSGYESVYRRTLAIPFCFPVEACQR
ncbi:MAG TPA: cell envelope integrity protein TolA [Chiayiivirga sp.]|nr:cell envelope integrity protein TolA [Chiayiivirga sp.]